MNCDKWSESAWQKKSAWDPGSQDPAYYAGLLLAVLNFPFKGAGGALLAITEGEVHEEHPLQA